MGPASQKPNFNQAPNPLGGAGYNGQTLPPQYNVGNITTLNSGRVESMPASTPELARDLYNAEQLARPTQAIPVVQPAQSVVQSTAKPQPVATTAKSTRPDKAQDVDQIEQAWVDQTKKVIANTRDDPFEQAHQVAELMRDYIKKRYGRIVGKSANK